LPGNGHVKEALENRHGKRSPFCRLLQFAGFTRSSAKSRSPRLLNRHSSSTSATSGAPKEMMEARVDAVFASVREDPQFSSP